MPKTEKKTQKTPLKQAITTEVMRLSETTLDFRYAMIEMNLRKVVDLDAVSVDTKTLAEMKKELSELKKSKTMILPEHRLFKTSVKVEVAIQQEKGLVAGTSKSNSDYTDNQNGFKKSVDKSMKTKAEALIKKNKLKKTELEVDAEGNVFCVVNGQKKQLKTYWKTCK